ncbi:MAG: VOC family protein [Deltaproteobacteria bacterium]|nr:VOC family protein [Deltaproteobacteria bacterium]
MLIGIHSVVVEVGDFEAAVDAFARLLDRRARVGPGARCAVFGLGNARLAVRGRGARGTSGAPLEPARDGLVGLRLAMRSEDAGRLAAGPLESPTVPIELVAESARAAEDGTGADAGADREPGLGREAVERIEAGIIGLDHVVIATGDPERTRAFLADELGIRLALDRAFPERGLRLLFFRLGGVTLELAAALPPQSTSGGRVDEERDALAHGSPRAARAEAADTFHGLAFKVRGLEATRARLEGAGFALSAIRAGHKAGTRVCSLRAPLCGIPTLLIEHPPRPGEGG